MPLIESDVLSQRLRAVCLAPQDTGRTHLVERRGASYRMATASRRGLRP